MYEKIGEDARYLKYRVNPKPYKIMIGYLFFGFGGVVLYYVIGAFLFSLGNFDITIQNESMIVGQILGLAVVGGLLFCIIPYFFISFSRARQALLQTQTATGPLWRKGQMVQKYGFPNESWFWYLLLYRVPSEIWVQKADPKT